MYERCKNTESVKKADRDQVMIELKGIYHDTSKRNPLAVLVQYDGRLLHVWHLTDPFYRLRSGSEFVIKSMKNRGRVIKFADGSSIETENTDALNMLFDKLRRVKSLKLKSIFKKGSILGAVTLFFLLIWIGWAVFT